MSRERVSLIFGGVSSEHDASVKSFANVYDSLREDPGRKIDLDKILYVDTEGRVTATEASFERPAEYYSERSSGEAESLVACFSRLGDGDDFLFSLLIGQYGEDGRVTALAQQSHVRGSFENFLASGLAMSKVHMNLCVRGLGLDVRIPQTVCLESIEDAESVFEELTCNTVIVKPNFMGASLFTERMTVSPDEKRTFIDLIEQILDFDQRALVQEYIGGVEYSCGCLRRQGEVIALPVIRIVPRRGEFYGHRQKHDASAGTEEEFVDPTEPVAAKIQELARNLFQAVGFEQMCRFDFIADDNGELYFLEGNALPGLMPRSLYTHMLHEVGLGVDDLILQCIENERSRRELRTTFRYEID